MSAAAPDMNPAARLRRLVGLVERQGPDGAWLAAAITARLARAAPTIDAGLGLVTDCGAQPIVLDRNARRDGLLRDFARIWLTEVQPSERPATLAAELSTFERRRWPALARRCAVPPNLVGTRDGDLAEIFRVGGVPLSAKQLRRIVSD